MADWNTELYLKFEEGRNKPIRDLISHIYVKSAGRVIDIGCGPGNSTILLKKVYKNANMVGIDNSPNMIQKAKQEYPEITWILKDIADDMSDLGKFDIVFSNSVLHWLPDHTKLLPRLFDLLNEDGVIAIQIPYFFGTPIYRPLYNLVESKKWDSYITVKQPTTYNDVGFYYDLLSAHFSSFDIWTTKHTHVLSSKDEIINWYKPTGFKAFLDQLKTNELKEAFLSDIHPIINDIYNEQKDGKFLLRFERLFFVAQLTK
ncbi:MAG: methyltransferase domain-containing protein [Firmicutes bacterium]|nr:methyltransferase domain-containing protein [Bacillota bacterium]